MKEELPSLLATASLLLALACRPPAPDPPGETPASSPLPETRVVEPRRGIAPLEPPQETLPPERWLEPSWPEGWVVADSGVVGPESLPVIWYRLDAGAVAPRAAARSAMEALLGSRRDVRLEDLWDDPASTTAIAHLRGAGLRASIAARAEEGATEVRVSAEILPEGF